MVFLSRILWCKTSSVYKTGSVIFSKSDCIFENLALETCLFDEAKFDDTQRGILLMWTNKPCVVIGRHQNPWLEANLKKVQDLKIDLVRRNSGGGTVYHDEGNLNISFIGPKNTYNRKRNLLMICDVLRTTYDIDAQPNDRDDIIVNGKYKVSGTASKLAHKKAYHHCTLLVNVNKTQLQDVLDNPWEHTMDTKSTRSVRSEIVNLKDLAPQIEPYQLAKDLGEQFCAEIQQKNDFHEFETNIQLFPNIREEAAKLKDWELIFGWTPRFKIHTEKVLVKTYHGRIDEVLDNGGSFEAPALGLANIVLRGKRFTVQDIDMTLAKVDSQRARLAELRKALIECVNLVSYT